MRSRARFVLGLFTLLFLFFLIRTSPALPGGFDPPYPSSTFQEEGQAVLEQRREELEILREEMAAVFRNFSLYYRPETGALECCFALIGAAESVTTDDLSQLEPYLEHSQLPTHLMEELSAFSLTFAQYQSEHLRFQLTLAFADYALPGSACAATSEYGLGWPRWEEDHYDVPLGDGWGYFQVHHP